MLTQRAHRALRTLHRWAGLALAAFTISVGLTGSLLAFYWELEAKISPTQFVEPQAGDIALAAGALANRVLQLEPRAYVTDVYLQRPGRAEIRVASRAAVSNGSTHALPFDEIIVNPFTGAELGRRSWGALSQGWQNLLPFIYEFHYSLTMGDFGVWLLGIAALLWTLDCFVGFIVTLPARSHHRSQRRPLWSRWKKAWKIQWRASRWRLNFDLHRAASLWLWGVLLVFAWSSVYMNLWDTVYTRITQSIVEFHPPLSELRARTACAQIPTRDWNDVNAVAVNLMAAEAASTGFNIKRAVSLRYHPEYCAYRYRVLSSLDMSDRAGHTDLYFDAKSDQVLLRYFPSGQHTGNTISQWLGALHMAQVFGRLYQIFVCIFGIALATISVTGVLIWWKRHHAVAKVR